MDYIMTSRHDCTWLVVAKSSEQSFIKQARTQTTNSSLPPRKIHYIRASAWHLVFPKGFAGRVLQIMLYVLLTNAAGSVRVPGS